LESLSADSAAIGRLLGNVTTDEVALVLESDPQKSVGFILQTLETSENTYQGNEPAANETQSEYIDVEVRV